MKTALFVSACLATAAAQPVGQPIDWNEALPLSNRHRAVLVLDSPASMRLRGILFPEPPAKKPAIGEILGLLEKQMGASLTIEWLGGDPVTDFKQSLKAGGQAESSCRIGNTTITRTVIASQADDAIFIHLLANQPGALSFRVKFDSPPNSKVKIEDRRQMILTPATGPASRVWVLPFESEVTPGGESITVQGEGEALIIWNFSSGKEPADDLAGTFSRLAEHHDPGATPPDFTKIWHGVLETHLKSIENSP